MVNRNAARHLLFAVSILLCFFIYMGYRMRGPKTAPAPAATLPAVHTIDAAPPAGLTPPLATPPAASGSLAPLRPASPLSPNDSLPETISGDDDFSDWVPAASPDDLALAPPVSGRPGIAPLPFDPAPESSSGDGITGLIPAPPQNTAPQAHDDFPSSIPSLPIPGSVTDMGLDDELPPPQALPLPSAGLKPPSLVPADDYNSAYDGSYDNDFDDNAGNGMPSGMMLPPPATPGYVSEPVPASVSPVSPIPPVSSVSPVAPLTPVPPAASLAPPVGGRPLAPESAPPPPVGMVPPPRPAAPLSPPAPETARPQQSSPSESLRIYVVRPGDTLSSIASQELGSVTLADNIFLLNRDVISDPDHLMVGIKIRLPIREGAFNHQDPTPPPAAIGRTPTYGVARTHIVARGDTLSSIAQRYYGSSSAWRFLYEANKASVPNPNALSVGAELAIPPYDN